MTRSLRLRRTLPILLLIFLFSYVDVFLSTVGKLPPNHFDPSAPKKNPNPPAPEFVRARNARRFPGEFFPDGYDVGEPAVTGTASSVPKWISPSAANSKAEKRIWFDPNHPEYRPPGTFLLNMLVMNEEAHLTRTLPQWSKMIDYWIIGVDEKNTDNSEAIIKKYLGHLPGMIAEVRGFDGHGPTWTTLVSLGVEYFPGATHGIISDADFFPLQDTLDRSSLDIRCSKHMYTIRSADYRNDRRMDWIYRNIPGAKIQRRTHQTVAVPPQPEQEVFQTLVPLVVHEQPGGFGDRSGNKEERYNRWMELDLIDYPDDPRALYYLGYGHLDLFNSLGGMQAQDRQRAAEVLDKSIHYFTRRVNLPSDVGNKEERWFATLKLAEIHERFKNDWARAEEYYTRCMELDSDRADPFFYVGQHYRLVGEPTKSEPHLYKAATKNPPERSLFMWYELYHCLAPLEYARTWTLLKPTLKTSQRALSVLLNSKCSDGATQAEREKWLKEVKKTIKRLQKLKRKRAAEKKKRQQEKEEEEAEKDKQDDKTQSNDSSPSSSISPFASIPRPPLVARVKSYKSLLSRDTKLSTLRSALQQLLAILDELDEPVESLIAKTGDAKDETTESGVTLYTELVVSSRAIETYLNEFDRIEGKSKSSNKQRWELLTCRNYRRLTTPILKTAQAKKEMIDKLVSKNLDDFHKLVEQVHALCR